MALKTMYERAECTINNHIIKSISTDFFTGGQVIYPVKKFQATKNEIFQCKYLVSGTLNFFDWIDDLAQGGKFLLSEVLQNSHEVFYVKKQKVKYFKSTTPPILYQIYEIPSIKYKRSQTNI